MYKGWINFHNFNEGVYNRMYKDMSRYLANFMVFKKKI